MTTEYKKGDKVVISVPEIGHNTLGKQVLIFDEDSFLEVPINDKHFLGKLEDFKPAEEKIKFTPEEKKEFDHLKSLGRTLFDALNRIRSTEISRFFPYLDNKLFNKETGFSNQFEFARAWENPELIELIEPRHAVKVANMWLWKVENDYRLIEKFSLFNENCHFTKKEIEEIAKLPKFKYIELVGAWEESKW
ncbi:hypothetical protein [Liquorilactobacillus hordei]|uniref:Uncharacterized protein n=1 Tax=Liquorilactobacillus hordei DSM 19519 TaxID=1423759 RepID=A0A0R1MUL8_9LACO|nr:hypothetical protein [Liquorilactobacillus hordei]KRL08011.1 hypothetical protein FC92_GL001083 [Liquorilactobacillus hordei DSM 19519]QYH51042.1 hypothetical protein G6O70_00315 [Liquorilactobacillus hordei DSM 19519]